MKVSSALHAARTLRDRLNEPWKRKGLRSPWRARMTYWGGVTTERAYRGEAVNGSVSVVVLVVIGVTDSQRASA